MKKQRAEDEAAELKSKINEHNEKKIGAVYGPTGNNVEVRLMVIMFGYESPSNSFLAKSMSSVYVPSD